MARDKIHNAVKSSLIKDGWTITDDPLVLLPNEENISIDLGAEKILFEVIKRSIERMGMRVIVVDIENETIESWEQ